ncbi:hypothetical protein [Kitasatospora kifunensis]|uniref:Uncharacterized protein n=1 Tax=Kitasatospora kifunensis TaxID=58351 RepID=A0A7W7VSY9_KITKI|nr:hypothetical protein [Kitasatospora kifunensis]MBB4921149.1 hypothetical protein [Kitasatospora kifunensis]
MIHQLANPPTCFDSLTARELSALGVAALGDAAQPHFGALAKLVEEVRFAGRTPTAAIAEQAWQYSDAVRRLTARAIPRWRRLLARLRPVLLLPSRH